MSIAGKIISGIFNKSGYRLLSKVSGQVIENMPEGAVSMTTRVIEHSSGIRKYIWTFLNENGKAVRTIHQSSDTSLRTVRDYDWFHSLKRTPKTKYREQIDPYAFENFGVRINKKVFDVHTNAFYENADTIVDINSASKTVTKSYASRISLNGNMNGTVYDESQITEIVKGKKTKEVYQKSESFPNSTAKVLDTRGVGLTPEQIKEATSNPYFYAMFKNPKDMIWSARTQAFTNQEVPFNINFGIKDLGLKGAAYYPTRNLILVDSESIKKGIKSMLIADFEHEARHAWQLRLIEKLDKGLLTDPQKIKMAQDFKRNLKNYVEAEVDHAAYLEQPLEDDAYKVTEYVYDKYQKSINYLSSLFSKASRKTLGE